MAHAFRRLLHALPLLALAGASTATAQTTPVDAVPQIGQVSKDSVWVPTPERLIHRMLQMADVTKDDVVMDLGSGDGRMSIHAARYFGARAIGVELEADLIRVSEEAARAQGVAHLTRFLRQDLFEADLAPATAFTLYISPGVMTRLKPKLLALKPGTRITSHHFTLDDWEPDETIRVENRTAYLWVVPADVRGRWKLTAPGDEFTVYVEQKIQMLATRGERAGRPVNVIGARLRGTEISFTAFDRDGFSRHFTGRVDGGRMRGTAKGETGPVLEWSAVRE